MAKAPHYTGVRLRLLILLLEFVRTVLALLLTAQTLLEPRTSVSKQAKLKLLKSTMLVILTMLELLAKTLLELLVGMTTLAKVGTVH